MKPAAVEETGTVKWFNAQKGFGFIVREGGGKDAFVHASVLERSGIEYVERRPARAGRHRRRPQGSRSGQSASRLERQARAAGAERGRMDFGAAMYFGDYSIEPGGSRSGPRGVRLWIAVGAGAFISERSASFASAEKWLNWWGSSRNRSPATSTIPAPAFVRRDRRGAKICRFSGRGNQDCAGLK